MPDFHLPERIVTLVFDKGPLLGLELEVRTAISIDAYFDVMALIESAADKKSGIEGLRTAMRRFAEIALVGWNVSNGSGPVPLTPESFTSHVDPRSWGDMTRRYIEVLGGKLGPLAAAPSASGSTSKALRASSSRSNSPASSS
jgi:hypothetical protein